MKVTTTFWSDEVHTFHTLLYYNGKTKKVMFETDLNNAVDTAKFFRNLSSFVKTKRVFQTLGNDEWFQFAVIRDGEITPIKWFDLHVGDVVLSHDIAFETTLIRKNGFEIPFGKFPRWDSKKKYPKYREFNIKQRAYKYIANQIRSQA
jgi:hypothetical protein